MPRSTAAPPPCLLTVAQAAEHLGTTTSKLYELVARHALPSVRIGRAIRIPQDAIDRFADTPGKADAVPPTNRLRTSRPRIADELEDLDRLDPSEDQHRSSTRNPPTSNCVAMPERSHSAQHPSEHRQPNSRETAKTHTDLHPRATRPRVDAASPREALS